jgi:hypothetical protein
MAVGDFNGDGKLDLVTANVFSNNVSVLLGNGDGTFETAQNYNVGHVGSLAVGDFNGDGRLDLAMTNGGSNSVSVLLGNGDGTFQTAMSVAVPTANFAVGDVNGDGKPDLVVLYRQTHHRGRQYYWWCSSTKLPATMPRRWRKELAARQAADQEANKESAQPNHYAPCGRGNGRCCDAKRRSCGDRAKVANYRSRA